MTHNSKHTSKAAGLKATAFILVAFVALMSACSSVDCPLNNRVYTTYDMLRHDGKPDILELEMTISTNRTDGSDSVLVNKVVNASTFSLPISNTNPRDTFFIELVSDSGSSLDTVVVSKTDAMHFESTDCSPSFFHSIQSVETTHHAVDSIRINNKTVDYDTSKHTFDIYFTPRQ